MLPGYPRISSELPRCWTAAAKQVKSKESIGLMHHSPPCPLHDDLLIQRQASHGTAVVPFGQQRPFCISLDMGQRRIITGAVAPNTQPNPAEALCTSHSDPPGSSTSQRGRMQSPLSGCFGGSSRMAQCCHPPPLPVAAMHGSAGVARVFHTAARGPQGVGWGGAFARRRYGIWPAQRRRVCVYAPLRFGLMCISLNLATIKSKNQILKNCWLRGHTWARPQARAREPVSSLSPRFRPCLREQGRRATA